jgi:hypothetical protein
MIDAGREAELLAQVRAYAVRSLIRPPITYPRGKNIADTWVRDIAIAVMVTLAAERLQLPLTRSRNTAEPSAAYFVAEAFRLQGHKLGERQVNRIVQNHSRLAARLAASLG